jgi:hypothetical protein
LAGASSVASSTPPSDPAPITPRHATPCRATRRRDRPCQL